MSRTIGRLRWGLVGGVLGGMIAAVGYFLLQPQTDSFFLFILLRVAVGTVVATILGPIIAKNMFKN